MKVNSKLAIFGASLALGAAPALALADPGHPTGPGSNHGNPTHSNSNKTKDPSSGTSNGKAYGKLCQAESKKHVAGQKGTPFSQCVTAMAKVAKTHTNPTTACKGESKKHVAGTKGTPYSLCVSAAAKLQHHS